MVEYLDAFTSDDSGDSGASSGGCSCLSNHRAYCSFAAAWGIFRLWLPWEQKITLLRKGTPGSTALFDYFTDSLGWLQEVAVGVVICGFSSPAS